MEECGITEILAAAPPVFFLFQLALSLILFRIDCFLPCLVPLASMSPACVVENASKIFVTTLLPFILFWSRGMVSCTSTRATSMHARNRNGKKR